MTLYRPNDELVLTTWLRTNVQALGGIVASNLPDPLPSAGFVTVNALPIGIAAVDVSARRESIQTLDFWAPPAGLGADKPQWGKAFQLVEETLHALDNDVQQFGAQLTIPPLAGDTYRPVRVLAIWATTNPRKIRDDPNAYAHITFDVECDWCLA